MVIMKGDISAELIARTAGEVADRIGLENLSLKEVAERLNIKSPSLIFHVKNLNGMKNIVSNYTISLIVAELMDAGFGNNGLDAVAAMGYAAVRFALEHPGMYESIQWMNIYYVPPDDEARDFTAFQQVTELFFRLFEGTPLNELEVSHIIRGFRCLIHGFATVAGHSGFGHPSDAAESFDYCLSLFINGIKQKLEGRNG